MKVEVRPIQKKRWHGKQGQESFTRTKKIQALVDTDKMEYATGLSEEDIEMLKDKGLKYDLTPQFSTIEPHEFWDSNMAVIKLENATMFFDDKNPMDFIKIKMLKASNYVANSIKDYNEGLFPEATHVLFDETEEVELKASKVAAKRKAIIEADKLSVERKTQIILILNGKNLKGKSSNFVEVELDKLLDTKANEVLRYIKMDSEDVSLHALILECVLKSVLRKQGHKYLYHESVLGGDVHEVIDYLKKDENQDLRLRLVSTVNK